MVKMDLKELQDYLGITDNDNYMYKADIIGEFRDLEKLIENMKDYKDLEIILKEDYYNLKLNNRIMYEGKNLIIYYNENKTQMELLEDKSCEEIARTLYNYAEDMDYLDYEETREQTENELINALEQIKAIAKNEYNSDYWRTFWNALQYLN